FNGNLDDVAHAGITAFGTTQHLDALHSTGSTVIGHFEHRFGLNHRLSLQLCPWAATATLASGLRGLLHYTHQHPSLTLGQRTALLNGDNVAFAALVVFIVRHQLG